MKINTSFSNYYEPYLALIELKFGKLKSQNTSKSIDELANELPNMGFCFSVLNKVSRSFAVVIQQLPPVLRESVALFYLILRALDSIEDDMTLPQAEKEKWLRNFYIHCGDKTLSLMHIGDKPEYRSLLQHYHKIAGAFHQLSPKSQNIIVETTRKMGNGMADFLNQKIERFSDYNLYCHYVAGLVGQGLTQLFVVSDYENEALLDFMYESNEMGLLLQKTNIIRDYSEDFPLGRYFLPEDAWKQQVPDYSYFYYHADIKSLHFFHTLLLDALQHVPHCLHYLTQIRNRAIFQFCAIPQVMAFFTLAALFGEKSAGMSPIKIKKLKAAQLMVYTQNINRVLSFLNDALIAIEKKLKNSDPLAQEIFANIYELHLMIKNKSFYTSPQLQI